MNPQEAEMWDRGMDREAIERQRRFPRTPVPNSREAANNAPSTQELVTVSVSMTPAEYESIRKNAQWAGKTVANYLVDEALGKNRRGC